MSSPLVTGILLPETILYTPSARVLTTFVAVNTVMYASLAIAKMLPKIHLTDLVKRSRDQRREDRSIYPP